MTCPVPTRVGQRYQRAGNVFEVTSLNGPEGPHWPIVLRTVRLSAEAEQEWRAAYSRNRALLPMSETFESYFAANTARPTHVEVRWFERSDVHEFNEPQEEEKAS